MINVLRVELHEDGADGERLDLLAGQLRSRLAELDVDDVARARADDVPPDARGLDAAALGALVVRLGKSAAGLRPVLATIRKWLAGGESVRRTVRLEIGGDVLELSHASDADQQRLIDLFIDRHSTGQDGQWAASGRR